ncbi:MAG: hypothetical protein ACI4U2_06755 [Christensenellaceae bacterium]
MNSRLLKAYELALAVDEWPWRCEGYQGDVQEATYQICLKYRRYEPQEEIWDGDVVMLTLVGNKKKYSGTKKLLVGSKMFDEAFEAFLPGKREGESFVYDRGEVHTEGRVEKIARLVVPFITDEMAKAEHIEGVVDADTLHTHLVREALKEALYDEFFDFIPGYLDRCEFAIDEADIDKMCEAEMERCRGISKELGSKPFDEMEGEELLGAVGCATIPEFLEMIRTLFHRTLRGALVGAAMKGEDGTALACENVPDYFGILRDETLRLAIEKMEREDKFRQ